MAVSCFLFVEDYEEQGGIAAVLFFICRRLPRSRGEREAW